MMEGKRVRIMRVYEELHLTPVIGNWFGGIAIDRFQISRKLWDIQVARMEELSGISRLEYLRGSINGAGRA